MISSDTHDTGGVFMKDSLEFLEGGLVEVRLFVNFVNLLAGQGEVAVNLKLNGI